MGRRDGPADFFVSYTSADRAWAEWIAWELEADGYEVVIQAWDFTPGRNWAQAMQQATSTAERVVAVLSPAYLASAHGTVEWEVFYAADPLGELGRLLPVRVAEVDPPGLLKTRVYVDLVGLDAASARAVLLAAAHGTRGKPPREPAFPGQAVDPDQQHGEEGGVHAPGFPGQLPAVWNVPARNPHFTGRAEMLEQLHQRLHAGEGTLVVQACTAWAGWARPSWLSSTPTGSPPTTTWCGGSTPSSRPCSATSSPSWPTSSACPPERPWRPRSSWSWASCVAGPAGC